MMNLGYDKPLYLLPLDHRGSFQKKMFGWDGALSAQQTAEIAARRRVDRTSSTSNTAKDFAKHIEAFHPTFCKVVENRRSAVEEGNARLSVRTRKLGTE